ncbi:SDR family NAD(P)-dependent oxidoreductase [Amycolatopsis sp. EV170708-02-1]|uniref:SDR family NAD(P)-dependent oxidoreductase n=1 Tax=Amycolatopsis sp. EV170708-02-1 TaxID=2919322 RepID=UPI001F0BAB18|nr:SDR family NAD(P)-dependent oxidoreductase [Amycolatopsis sp. EV170708-02-1]UMP06881.1 SDR family oxidoreductase [Amycolatopsis sp. EV170708-02-1]
MRARRMIANDVDLVEELVTQQLSGKTAIVTGAASGIGRATAALFAARGAVVLAVDRDEHGLAGLRTEARAAGAEVRTLAVDLTAEGAAEQVFEHCAADVGTPDVLANIAGKAGDAPAGETSDADFEFFLKTNLGTAFALSRRAVHAFGDRGGAIVNTSSTFALTGVAGSAPYSAAKGAVTSLTRQMAADYGRRGIRVNAVAPGLIETPATREKIAAGVFDDLVTRARPLPRVGRPIDIAHVFAFLASDDAAFITGVTIPVCGGWSTTHFRD